MKLRFKIGKLSIEDLAVDFEGNEQERRVVERMVDVVSSLPGAVVDVDTSEMPPQRQIASAPPPLRPRRRRSLRQTTSTNGSPTSNDGTTAEPNAAEKPTRARKARGTSYYSQVTKLVSDNFFSQTRSRDEVNTELSRRGYNFEKYRVGEALVKLTKNETLSRTPDPNSVDEWLYENGPKK